MKNLSPLRFYKTTIEQVQYVGWLLACDSDKNIEKGESLMCLLPDDDARAEAQAYALMLTKLYAGA